MVGISFIRKFRSIAAIIVLSSFLISCSTQATSRYWGQTKAPSENVLRYVSGSEPQSLDPQIPTGQPEARVLMALYDGLVEYHPKTMEAIPSIAESWEASDDGTEYLFHLRQNARFSNGDPIKAKDFVYTFRRALSPELAAENAYLSYYVKYAEPYNAGKSFVRTGDGQFLLEKDLEAKTEGGAAQPEEAAKPDNFGPDTETHRKLDEPMRYTLASVYLARAATIENNEKLKQIFQFKAQGIVNPVTFAGKIKNGNDSLSAYLRGKFAAAALDACAADACTDEAKNTLAGGLNQIIAGDPIYRSDVYGNAALTDKSREILKEIEAENKKRETANAAIDEEIAKAEDEKKKQDLAKDKKQPVGKFLYLNRAFLENQFPEELGNLLVPVTAEDIGVEAIDDYTFRIKLLQPAPYFLGLLGHQYFRVVHQPTIEKFKGQWTKQENIVTSGSYKLAVHKPYDKLIVVRDPYNWDAANVRLDRIEFYPLEEQTTMQNLYKAGEIDATYNHTIPSGWIETIKQYKHEYMLFPEAAIEYYSINTKRAPMDNFKVRQAFALAVDRESLAKFRKTVKPLTDFTPEGIFPGYEKAREKVYVEKLKEVNITPEQWKKRIFDPERARKLLTEAGYPVEQQGSGWICPTFPVEKINVNYNTSESNKAVAEFLQAQWKQNLGITVPLKNMEWKTFLPSIKKLDFNGIARRGWTADYMDPFTYLQLFYSPQNDSSTGWFDAKYDKMLDDANKMRDPQKRFEMLAEAEFFLMSHQVVIPLATSGTNWIKKPYVKGMYPNAGTLHPWKFIYIERDPNKWDADVENILKQDDPQVEQQVSQLMRSQLDFEQSKNAAKEETAAKEPTTAKAE